MKTTYTCDFCGFTTTDAEKIRTHEQLHKESENRANNIMKLVEEYNKDYAGAEFGVKKPTLSNASPCSHEHQPSQISKKPPDTVNNPSGERLNKPLSELLSGLEHLLSDKSNNSSHQRQTMNQQDSKSTNQQGKHETIKIDTSHTQKTPDAKKKVIFYPSINMADEIESDSLSAILDTIFESLR